MKQNNKIQNNFLPNPKGKKKYTYKFIVGSVGCENETMDKGMVVDLFFFFSNFKERLRQSMRSMKEDFMLHVNLNLANVWTLNR